jgi:hypothetical protein
MGLSPLDGIFQLPTYRVYWTQQCLMPLVITIVGSFMTVRKKVVRKFWVESIRKFLHGRFKFNVWPAQQAT